MTSFSGSFSMCRVWSLFRTYTGSQGRLSLFSLIPKCRVQLTPGDLYTGHMVLKPVECGWCEPGCAIDAQHTLDFKNII